MTGDPLILASTSAVRRQLFEAANVPVAVAASGVDEDIIKRQSAHLDPAALATALATAKALAVNKDAPGRPVLGCDQLLILGDSIFDKPADMAGVRRHLRALRGNSHTLLSAAVLVQDNQVLWQTVETAVLQMRDISDTFIEHYIAAEGDILLTSVGAYRLGGMGVQLFSSIVGDHFTILGLPLLRILEQLRKRGMLTV